jgi:hypothetical protein
MSIIEHILYNILIVDVYGGLNLHEYQQQKRHFVIIYRGSNFD